MDKHLLLSFQDEIKQVEDYITHINHVNDFVAYDIETEGTLKGAFDELKEHHEDFANEKKKFEYKAIIVSLYGMLEKHIELWVKEFLDKKSTAIRYNELSTIIQNNHFALSLRLMSMIIEGRWEKYRHLRKEDVLNKLHTCTVNPANYHFNSDAFIIQSGNLKHSRIEEIFTAIDIPITKQLIKSEELLSAIGIDKQRANNTEASVIFAKLNEIVERRNEIAHGSEIDDLLSLEALSAYLVFLEKYCSAVFYCLEMEYIKDLTTNLYAPIEKEDIKHVLNQEDGAKKIICFAIKNHELNIGDYVIVQTSDSLYAQFPIKSIQVDKKDKTSLKITEEIDVGISIENPSFLSINKNSTFYLKARRD